MDPSYLDPRLLSAPRAAPSRPPRLQVTPTRTWRMLIRAARIGPTTRTRFLGLPMALKVARSALMLPHLALI